MKKKELLIGMAGALFLLIPAAASSPAIEAKAAPSGPTSSSLSSKMNIDLRDNSESEIREYYQSLNSLSASERTGTYRICRLEIRLDLSPLAAMISCGVTP